MPAIALALDQAAIRDALAQLRKDAATLPTATAPGQALASAAAAVDASAESTTKQLDAAIAQYLKFPTLIQKTADAIEGAAMTGGARSLDYSSLVRNLKAAQSSQSAASDAKTSVQGATAEAASATAAASAAGMPGASQAQNTLKSKGGATATPKLDEAASTVAGVAAAAVPPASAAATDGADGAPALNATSKQDALTGVLTLPANNDMTRVSEPSKDALDDLPNPDYSIIAVNIQTCWPAK